ncbi:MAG: YeeE/YedE thiosulfate transporter family protein [Lysobacterales bacterium]
MNIFLYILALLLAATVGIFAHRAGICTFAAVKELLDGKQPNMLLSFLKVILWVMAVMIAFKWIAPAIVQTPATWRLSISAIIGGLIFGIGVAVNRGCAISTLRDLADGRFAIIGTFAGMYLGIALYRLAEASLSLPQPTASAPILNPAEPRALALLGLLGVWILWEVVTWFRTRGVDSRSRQLALAAAFIGISNGILFAVVGAWMYTGLFRQHADFVFGNAEAPRPLLWLLFVSVLAGMVLSSVRTGKFRAQFNATGLVRHLSGGLLMGVGAASIPGGNDVLMLHGIPGFSYHAVPTFLAMLAGIALTLLAGRVGVRS